jgi:glycosyltransferase involved in cell wall biosynthesis
MRLAIFGTFYPQFQYAGNSTTGIVILAGRIPSVDRLVVFCQAGARAPEGAARAKLDLRPVWRHDDPVSLVGAGLALLRALRRLDGVVFNTYVTAFGRSGLANAVGLLLPPFVASLSRRPVVVYMHNFVETQDVRALGYAPGRGDRTAAQWLERLLLRRCRVVVPLVSQQTRLSATFGQGPDVEYLPYIEAVASLTAGPAVPSRPAADPGRLRLLVFGSLGPQKDIPGFLRTLNEVAGDFPLPIEVTVAGGVNARFPSSRSEVDAAVSTATDLKVTRVEGVDDEAVLALLRGYDGMVLPYNATGGMSGAMNVAALAGVPVIAYDLPQLREQADLLRLDAAFVQKGSPSALRAALVKLRSDQNSERSERASSMSDRLASAQAAVGRLLQRVAADRGDGRTDGS